MRDRPSPAKRLMRTVCRRLPASAVSYKLAKAFTRTLLRPERNSLVTGISFGGGFPLLVDLGDIVGNDLYCLDRHYEAATLARWCALAREATTIVDLGSHVGLFACAAAAVNDRARILAVEAFARNAELLRANAAAFPNIVPIEAAVAPTGGRWTFQVCAQSGGGKLTAAPAAHGLIVEAMPLADLCERSGMETIDLMKIDLEGLESRLLGDQDRFWARWRPRHVVVEMTVHRAGTPIFAVMTDRGYRRRRLERLHAVPWPRRESLANWHFWRAA